MKAKTKIRTESGEIDTRRWKWPLAGARATKTTFVRIIADRASVSTKEAEAEFNRALRAGEIAHVSNLGLQANVKAYQIVKQ